MERQKASEWGWCIESDNCSPEILARDFARSRSKFIKCSLTGPSNRQNAGKSSGEVSAPAGTGMREQSDLDKPEQRCPSASREPPPALSAVPNLLPWTNQEWSEGDALIYVRLNPAFDFSLNKSLSSVLAHSIPTFFSLSLHIPSTHVGCFFPDSGIIVMGLKCWGPLLIDPCWPRCPVPPVLYETLPAHHWQQALLYLILLQDINFCLQPWLPACGGERGIA